MQHSGQGRVRSQGIDRALALSSLIAGPLLIFIAVAWDVRVIASYPDWPYGTDLEVYIKAGRAVLSGQSPYVFGAAWLDPFPYPPFFAGIIAVLTSVLGTGKLWIAWSALCLFTLAAAFELMLRRTGHAVGRRWVLIAIGIVACSRVARSDVVHGQINFLILILLVLGLHAILRQDYRSGSIAWALMIICKPFMGVILLYPLVRRQWTVLAATLALATIFFVISLLPVLSHVTATLDGWLQSSHWHTSLPNVAKPDNQSIFGMLMRAFTDSIYSQPWLDAPWLPRVLILPFIAVAIFVATVTISQDGGQDLDRTGASALLEIGVIAGLFLSCGPLFEGDHIFVLLPGLCGAGLMARARLSQSAPNAREWLIVLALWSLALVTVVMPVNIKPFAQFMWERTSGWTILASGRLGFSVYAACIATAVVLWRERVGRPDEHWLLSSRPWGRERAGRETTPE